MKSQYALPFTIIVAGALIAGAIFISGKSSTQPPNNSNQSGTITARPYTPGQDHILGNPNAKVKVVEYLDLECPHCKVFNDTMQKIMAYYGPGGNVAWVERPFPLASIHSKAPEEAQAAECAAAQGGDTGYFNFVNKLFEVTPSDNGLDLSQLPVIAQSVGLNGQTLMTCVNAGTYANKIQNSYNEAISYGAQGTPFTLVMIGDQAVALPGEQPYDSMRAAIDAVLANVGATASTTAQ